jgi:hypothetical protein
VGGFNARTEPECAKGFTDVPFRAIEGDAKFGADAGVGIAKSNEAQDLALARSDQAAT